MKMKRIKKPIEFLLENGLLFEINRRVLHPLGLALEVEIDDDGKVIIGSIWDCRSDPEGVLFSPDTWQSGKDKIDKYMEDCGNAAVKSRQEIFGFLEQTTKTVGKKSEE
jgi:hypothetical protein